MALRPTCSSKVRVHIPCLPGWTRGGLWVLSLSSRRSIVPGPLRRQSEEARPVQMCARVRIRGKCVSPWQARMKLSGYAFACQGGWGGRVRCVSSYVCV